MPPKAADDKNFFEGKLGFRWRGGEEEEEKKVFFL